ncbi:GNAT family N-acetyltransferase [Saccharomonospora sp. NPDC046836]|uniref:GNAT family N-acetyltransferase n=1 Tax=Saccharomonospora sp. NPDC046836 TaxID=3156921 RepID=UPI00340E6725
MEIEYEQSIAVLVTAFQHDPVSRWVFPDDATRPAAMARLFAPLVRRSAATGDLATAGDGAAVAVWVRLAAGETGMEDEGELPPELAPHVSRLVTFAELAGRRHPHDRAHLYLPFLGVAPAQHGRGLGSELLARRLACADAEGLPAYLEASSARSRPLYARHGFCDTGEPITLPDGPPLWPMWREPSTQEKGQ